MVNELLTWYNLHKRDLPWRNTRDPYKIWVSEVILQQTRVDQGLPYYYNFITHFPDINALATAPEDQVLKVWQGLGYYSRARNMIKAARQINQQFGGNFPENYEILRSIYGIGPYTAAAVASFAFGLPHPAIDGNVRRVASRWFGLDIPVGTSASDKVILSLLQEKMRDADVATFNQAMMELGATVCRPAKADCDKCPLAGECVALAEGRQADLPVTLKKKAPTAVYLDFMWLVSEGHTWIRKRDDKGIWKGLYELPCEEIRQPDDNHPFSSWFSNPEGVKVLGCHHRKHQLTHRTIFARLWHLSAPPYIIVEQKDYVRVPVADLRKYPVHRLMAAFLYEMELTI